MTKPGSNYIIEYKKSVVKKDIPQLSTTIKRQAKLAIESKLAINPIEYGKPLQYSFKGYRRLRVGDYRIVYKIEEKKKIVFIAAIKHRREIYN